MNHAFCYAPAMFPSHHHVYRGPHRAYAVPLTLSAILTAVIVLSTAARAQTNHVNARIADIRFKNRGIGQFNESKARKALSLKPGARLNPRKLRSDIKSLMALGYFEEVSAAVTEAPDAEIIIDYDVMARPLVNEVRTEAPARFSIRKIERILRIRPGKRIDQKTAAHAADSLMNYYRDHYYYTAKVGWSVVPTSHPGWVDFILKIEEGQQGVVTELTFDGNKEFTDKELSKIVSVKPCRNPLARWARNDAFYTEQLQEDYKAIQGAYHARGYMTIKMPPPDIQQTGPSSVRIAWHIEEGLWYRVATIRFAGSPQYSDDWSKKWISLQPKDLLTPRLLRKAAFDLQSHYRGIGYPYAKVTAAWKPIETKALADVILEVEPGRRERVRHITVSGSTTTHDEVIVREIDVKQGGLYDEAEVARSARRLESLPAFEKVTASATSAETPDECDIEFVVEERNTGKIEAGISAGTVEGAAVASRLAEANFSFRPPFRGAGYQASVDVQYGDEHRNLDLSFLNPRILDSRFYLAADLKYGDIEYQDDYSQRTLSAALQAGRSFARYHKAALSYQWNRLEVYDVEADASPLYEEETVTLGAISGQYTFKALDRQVRPKNGIYFTIRGLVGSDDLGGDTELYNTDLRSSFFWSPGRDHVLNLQVAFKSVEPYGDTETVPLPLRLFLGGPRDLRGFEYQTVSPRDEDGNEIGGLTSYFASLEYTIPLPVFSWLDGSVYYDIGNVTADAFDFGDEEFVSDVGVGLMIRAQNMPLRLDLAWPLEVSEDDFTNEEGRHRFSFAAGYNF